MNVQRGLSIQQLTEARSPIVPKGPGFHHTLTGIKYDFATIHIDQRK